MDLHEMVATMPHATHLGIVLRSASKEAAEASMPRREDLCTIGATAHGGALMAFADSVGAIVAFLNLPEGAGTSTIESKTNFFRPLASGAAHASTHLVHAGRRTIVVSTEVRGDDGKLLSLTTQTQAVLT